MKIKISFIKDEKSVEKDLILRFMDENYNSLRVLENINPTELENALVKFIKESLNKTITEDFVKEMLRELVPMENPQQ